MGGSEEETVTRDESTSDSAGVDDAGESSDPQSEDPRIEPLERWFDSIERDFDGSQTQKLRGLGKYAVTWLVALSAVGVLFGLILHVLVTLLPFTLFGSHRIKEESHDFSRGRNPTIPYTKSEQSRLTPQCQSQSI